MAINISHPTNTIDGQDVLNLKSGNSENIELSPDSGLVNVNGDINITGNFRVQGTTTTVNSTTTTIVDPIIVLGTDEDGNPLSTDDGKDRGISFFYKDGVSKTGFFGFDASNNDFRFIPDATITNEIVTGANGTITINRLNSVDVYTDSLDVSIDANVHGNLTVDNNITTTTLDAGDLNIVTNVISSDISGNIILDPGEDSIDVSNSNIINLAEPNNSQDAATKNYVDSLTSAISVLNIAGDFGSGSVDLELGTFTLNGTQYQIETTVSNDVITFSLPTNLIVPGSLEVTTNLLVNENTTTTTLDAGDLNITDNVISSDVSGDIIIDSGESNIQLIGNTNVTGDLDVTGNITLGGNITIGDQTIDSVNVIADFTSNLIPKEDITYNLGSETKRWDHLYVGTVVGNVNGQISDISNHTTNQLAEGTGNLYFTEQRVKDTLSAGTGLTYLDGVYSITDTGVILGTYGDASNIPVITINEQGQITSASTISVAGVTDFQYDTDNGDLTISTADGNTFVATVTLDPFTTDTLTEGENNLYYTPGRVRSELSAGTGVYYDSINGVISIGQSVDTNSDVTFNNITVTNNTTTDTLDAGNLNITTNVISSDISGDIRIESGADNIELVGNTNVTGDLTVSGMTYSDLTGNVTGQVSDISNHTTDELTEGGTNLYYTSERVLNELSAGTGVYYNNTSGVISIGQSVDTTSNVTFNDVLVSGNLTVQGTTTSVNSTTVDIADLNLTLAKGSANASEANGAGITVDGANATITYLAGTDSWNLNKSLNVTGDISTTGSLSAPTFIGDLTGNVTGQVSDISNHTTDELTEGGTNLYYTSERVLNELSAVDAGGDGSFSYNNSTGEFTYTGPSASETQAHFSAGTGLTYNAGEFSITNTSVTAGNYGDASNIPVITINEQGQITSASTVSVAGVTNFEYNTTNAELTISTADGNTFIATVTLDPFTTDTLDEGLINQYYTSQRVRDELSAGTGVYYDNATGVISIGQSVDTISDVTFNSVNVTTNTTTTTLDAGNLNITTNVISSDIAGDIIIDSGADNIELIGNTNVTGDLNVSGEIYGNLTGNVTGQVSDISNHTTTELTEGTNLYYTDERVKLAISAVDAGGDGSFSYDNITGEFTYTGPSALETQAHFSATTTGTGHGELTYDNTSGTFTLTKVSVADIRGDISAVDSGGDGSFSYDSGTGEFTYTGPSASETQAHFSAGTGLTYDAGEFSITNTGVTAGEYGDSSNIPVLTINEQGQVTAISTTAVAGVTDFTYDSNTADLTISTADGNEFVATINLNPFSTSDLTEGSRLYYLDSRARAAVSATKVSGFGDLTYNDTDGVFSYTGPSSTEILNLLNAGTGVYFDYGTGTISIGQSVDTTSNVQFNNVDTVTLDAGNLNITTNVISSDISGDIIIDSGADSIELIGDTNVTGNLSVTTDAIIYGNLTVQGTTTSINSTNTEITDNTIVLNQGETGAGVSSGTSGIEIARGSLFNASWKWNEITGRWEAKEGTDLTAIAVSEIDAGNLNMSGNTISSTDTNGNINLTPNGTGQVLYKDKHVATHDDAIAYAIVFGG